MVYIFLAGGISAACRKFIFLPPAALPIKQGLARQLPFSDYYTPGGKISQTAALRAIFHGFGLALLFIDFSFYCTIIYYYNLNAVFASELQKTAENRHFQERNGNEHN